MSNAIPSPLDREALEKLEPELRKVIEELLLSEERHRTIAESMADWFWECDRDANFTMASEKVLEILGYQPREVVGRSSFDFMEPEEARRLRPVMRALAESREPIRDLQNWNVAKDGTLRCILTNGVPMLSPDGSLKGYRGVDKDITAQKLAEESLQKSEAKYRELFTRASIGIILSDSTQRVVDANPEALRILGYDLQEIRALSGYDLVHPEDLAAKPLASTPDFGLDDIIRINRRYRHKNGDYLPVFANISRNGEGYFLIMFQDMTSQRRMERQLVQAQKMEAVGTLSSGIAHDFNNILQAIMGFSQLLADEKHLTPGARAHIQRIEASVGRGAALVRNLLAFSRAEKPSIHPVDVNREVSTTAEMLARTLPKMIRIRTCLANGLPPIAADAAQFEQVLINLATNARDAMPSGGELTFETSDLALGTFRNEWSDARSGHYVMITVTDTGSGMDRETVGRIFEPFFTTKAVGSGTGLGLSSAYGIVKNHGGHIRCASEPGKGTAFTIIFPATEVESDEENIVIQPGYQNGSKPLGKGTILVVDDEEDVRDVAVHGLGILGYTTIPAQSGEEALEILEKGGEAIDVVLLDLGMPGMGGEKCLGIINETRPDLKVLIASGYAMPETPDGLITKGAAAFIRKPYRLKNLAEIIDEVMKSKG